MARRNTYREDEVLETPFDYHHLLRAFVYIKKYLGMMIFALVLSAIGGITGLFGPVITQKALDEAIPDKDVRMLFILVALLCGTFILSIIFTTIRSKIMINVSQNIIYDIRKDIFDGTNGLFLSCYSCS